MMSEYRNKARENAQTGVAYLARAINACDNPEITYQYSKKDIERFKSLLADVIEIIETGDIVIKPAQKDPLKDKSYIKFRDMVFSADWYDDKEKFKKAAYYSTSPLYRNESMEDKLKRWKDMD